MSPNTLTVGTRKSPLAMAQAELVVASLQELSPADHFPIHGTTTTGDRDQNTALYNFGGKGLWTTQLEEMLTSGAVDMVVHSLKDMPTTLPPDCALGAITKREDPRDILSIKKTLRDRHGWSTIADLPAGSVVGTSSIRRIAQLARRYPHLRFKDVRGNIQTRLRKLDEDPELSAIVLAAAGLLRMQLGEHITQYLHVDNGGILHAVGQGALAVECRAGDERVSEVLRGIEDRDTTLACLAERSLMRELEGGCSVPIGVETRWVGDGGEAKKQLRLRATVVSVDGKAAADVDLVEGVASRDEAEALGRRAAKELLSEGADGILEAINRARPAVK